MFLQTTKNLFSIAKKNFNIIHSFQISDTFPNNNKIFRNFSDYIQKLFTSNENVTYLHRWCNTTSPIYKNTCDVEKKIEFAGKDNCFSNNLK